MEVKAQIVLIDFSALFRRAWHVQSDISHAYEATIGGVNRASALFKDSLVAICCDGKGNWRKEISKEYKAQREAQPASMHGEMDRTLDRLRRDGRLIWKFDGFEADDVIATATMCAKTRGHSVSIVSHDKDLLQLLCPSVEFVAIHKSPWETVNADIVLDKYGIEATQFADWLALVGDSSDNVKGCPGVGAKTATDLLKTYGSIDGIYKALEQSTAQVSPNARKNLENHKEDVSLARKLVSLRVDVPLKFDEIYESREIQPIDERDEMSEAEKDADKFFGKQDAPKTAAPSVKPEGTTEPPEPERNGSVLTELVSERDLKQTQSSPVPADVEDKQPGEMTIAIPTQTEVVQIVEYSKQLEPRSFREAMVYADVMFHSRIYSRYPTKASIAAAVVRGREMGYGAGASLDIFHVADFNNDGNLRLMLHAHVIIDRAMRDPGLEYFALVESDATHAIYEAKVKRNPKPTRHEYTIEDARTAKLIKERSNWEKRPKEQLRKTCGVQLARIVAPWSALGLYCPEELGVEE